MRWLPLYFVLALTLPQCGGSSTATEPKTADSEASDDSQGSGDGDAKSDDAEDAEDGSAAEAKPRGPSCDDGTCTVCGSGICPSGWYCDESAPGGAACAWLKECAEKASCGCVTKVLGSSCKCRDDGGIKVSCN
jgi:hypothetical protein